MTRPFHPALFAAFPTLFLLRENLWGLRIGEVAWPLAASVAAVTILLGAGSVVSRRPSKVAAVLSVVTLLFFSYGHVWGLIADETGRMLGMDADVLLGPALLALAALAAVAVVRAERGVAEATKVLNIVGIALVASVCLPLGLDVLQDYALAGGHRPAALPVGSDGAGDARRPDIYYLVFDRYANQRTLEEVVGYDNERFIDSLEERGFVVAPDAKANYHSTDLSLATSLNMEYLDWIPDELGVKSKTMQPVEDAISAHAVGRFLRARGYRYVHVGSRWDVTRDSEIADVNITIDETSEFTRVFLGSTALLPLMRRDVIGPAETDRIDFVRSSTIRQFEEAEQATRLRGPKFVFAHFLVPHPPYAFDADGGRGPVSFPTVEGRKGAYLEQLKYTNDQIEELLDVILSGPKESRPIVILAADEGPYPGFGWNPVVPWWKASDDDLRTKFGILTAMHLPGTERGVLYPDITPVNVFRLVFNEYFDTKLPLLPDEAYVSYSRDEFYRFVRITERIN